MKRWRIPIICLLLVTVPLSLWATSPAPQECVIDRPGEPGQHDKADTFLDGAIHDKSSGEQTGHDHHAMMAAVPQPGELDASQIVQPEPGTSCSCCDACLITCPANNPGLPDRLLAALEPPTPDTHFSKTHASQLLPGPAYPSLFRPPISPI